MLIAFISQLEVLIVSKLIISLSYIKTNRNPLYNDVKMGHNKSDVQTGVITNA